MNCSFVWCLTPAQLMGGSAKLSHTCVRQERRVFFPFIFWFIFGSYFGEEHNFIDQIVNRMYIVQVRAQF